MKTYSANPEIPKEYHWIIDLRLRAMAKINNDMSLSQEYSVRDAIVMREIYFMGVEEGKIIKEKEIK